MTISKSFKEYCYGTVILNISETWGWFIDLDVNESNKRKQTFSNNNSSLLRNINNYYNNTKKNPIIKRLRSRPSLSNNLNDLENKPTNILDDIFEMDNEDYEDHIRKNYGSTTTYKVIHGIFIVFIGLYIFYLI